MSLVKNGITNNTPSELMFKAATLFKNLVAEYTLTTDTALVEGKTYYTRTGTSPNYTYTAVVTPNVSNIATYYEYGFNGTVLGATSGGSKFTFTEEFVDAEVDGALVKFKGGKVKISEAASIEGNFTEFKEDLIKDGLHLVENSSKSAGGYKCYVTKGSIIDGDYLINVAMVGELTSGKNVILILPNAYCTSGLEIEPKDKEQATFALTFEAHADISGDLDHLPVEIYYPQ